MGTYVPQNATETGWSAGQVIRWWERRRIIFNVAVGLVGIAAVTAAFWIQDGMIPMRVVLLGFRWDAWRILAFGLMANACYSLGPMMELLGRRQDAAAARRRARWMFRNGMIAACLLTTMPVWYAMLSVTL